MTKEELEKEAEEYASEEDICVCGDEYWSHNDIKQAYLAGAEPRERRIEQLEAQIEQNKIDLAISEHDREHNDYELTEVYTKVEQLKKENAKLKCECRTCVYTDSPCVRSDYPNKDGVCSHYKNVLDENTELREINKMLEQGYVWHDYDAGEDCYEDNHEGKWVKRDEVYQLTKAKELLERLLITSCNSDVLNLLPNCSEVLRVRVEAEQFLSEVEK